MGNNGAGIAGVNWGGVSVLACKFLDAEGVGYVSALIDCIHFCVRHNATISSNSYALGLSAAGGGGDGGNGSSSSGGGSSIL